MDKHLKVVTDAIVRGELDSEIWKLEYAILTRKKAQERATIRGLQFGQTVWLNDNVHPKYLRGVECKVIKVNSVRVNLQAVQPGPHLQRFASGNLYGVKTGLITTEKPGYAKPVYKRAPESEAVTITKLDLGSMKGIV